MSDEPDQPAPVPASEPEPEPEPVPETRATPGSPPAAEPLRAAGRDAGARPFDAGSARAAASASSGAAARRGAATAAPRREARAGSPLAAIALFLVVLEGVALGALWAHPRLPPDAQARLDRLAADVDGAHAQAAAAADAATSLRGGLAAQQAALDSARHTLDDLQTRVAAGASAPTAFAPTAAAAQPAPSAATDADLQALRQSIAAAREESRNAVASIASLERSDIAAVRTATTAAIDEYGRRLDTLGTRLDQQAAIGNRARDMADRAERLARLQAAGIALADGRPLGAIPNAPPAVALFADRSPPTLASLVLSFPDAGRQALRASEPNTHGLGFFRRLWTRAEAAVTVREGNRVIVGDPAAGIIAAAHERLEAGDLAGAVATLGELNGAAADAIDPWRSRAASLVDARAGLADMMAHS